MNDTPNRKRIPFSLSGLSARLLLLTITFVLLSEVLIYVPSIARFRMTYLQEKLAKASLASLALKATNDLKVSSDLENELLAQSGLKGIIIKQPSSRTLMLSVDMPGNISATYDLRNVPAVEMIMDAFHLLLNEPRNVRVIYMLPNGQPGYMEVILHEKSLREAMLDYSINIMTLSIVISLITATLVYLSLHFMMVLPMRRLMQSMIRFRQQPDADDNIIAQSGRRDEIGAAEHELSEMQQGLKRALKQQARLATLGAGVSKINHDLRNILATAQLVSDRLGESLDPQVRRLAPTLVKSIDRAIDICGKTLSFSKVSENKPNVTEFSLREMMDDVALFIGLEGEPSVKLTCDVPRDIWVCLDRDQAFRVFLNLGRNAVDAIRNRKQRDGHIRVQARMEESTIIVVISDNGPGLPEEARENLFQPFSGSTRSGGTGLGVAIARELARGHRGDVTLISSDDQGTAFEVRLQNQPVPIQQLRAS